MGVDFLEPVSSRSTVQDGIYRQLRDALMSGQFAPGQTLTIAMLAETFRTSHMPVREALRRLTAENALVVVPNGSAQVPTVTLEGLDDICLTRVALETLATRLATARSTPEDHRAFRRLAEAHVHATEDRDMQGMLACNRDFHFAVYNACGSTVLVQLIQTLWLRFGPYMRMISTHMGPILASGHYQPTEHHFELLNAMNAGDARTAAKAMKSDIETTQSLLRKLCREELAKTKG